jgi:hypothetical protein
VSKIVQASARKLPTMLGAGILAVSIVGLTAAVFGFTFPLVAELASAVAGMAIGGKYA